ICGEPHCQAHTGAAQATAATTAAVRATRGQVLFGPSGMTDTVYHSACGGHTEAWHAMWGGAPDPTLSGVPDAPMGIAPVGEEAVARFIAHPPVGAWCAQSARRSGVHRWTKRVPGARVTAAVNAKQAIGPVVAIVPLRRGVSGRVLEAQYIGRDGKLVVKGATANRRLLGRLRSGLWVVERRGGAPDGPPDEWIFHGGGFGHGVGLCQHGALGQARAGYDYRAILNHYYPGARIESIW
ncbi:MAG: SpoIID/LytB domain-containing protein, partial [Myxococcales bacterium]|nr:SpoIID/LytB domain-containing protein [Myxococcales bacterium]